MTDPADPHADELARYADLWDEARRIRGISLWQDAWRRLRKSRISMLALATLAAIGLLAVLTPILPLQPPDQTRTAQKYAPPVWSPLVLPNFHFNAESLAASAAAVARIESDIVAASEAIRGLRAKQRSGTSGVADPLRAAERERETLYQRLRHTIQRPYTDAGYAELGPLSRWMVRCRASLFGDRSLGSVCGRDALGRDVLSRIFWGARISLIVGLVAALVSLVIGVSYGAVAGYLGGWVDDVMMRIVDVLYSIPFIFVVIFLITVLSQEDIKRALEAWGINRITIFFFVVGAIYWLTMARVVRGQVISLKNEQFVEAARTIGARPLRIVFLHLVPNLMSVIIVYLTLTIPRVMLFEAFLSFLGLGVEPPDVSWGLLANEGIRVITKVKIYWWLVLFPSIALGGTLFALNFLGDGLRDALDPRMKNR